MNRFQFSAPEFHMRSSRLPFSDTGFQLNARSCSKEMISWLHAGTIEKGDTLPVSSTSSNNEGYRATEWRAADGLAEEGRVRALRGSYWRH
jgi:hypothetical protein